MGSVEQFVQSWTDSGLLASEEIRRLIAQAPASVQQDSQHLAQHLVELEKLTPYQAEMLCQGRGKGLVLGNYLLLDKLGQGGMGVVYRARHRRLDRVVALKVLPTGADAGPGGHRALRREAQAAAKLSHANFVTAHDADEADGVHFLVTEYVAGQDLAQRVRAGGPLTVEQALDYVLQAARGLAHAHEGGILHRDVKPSNLMLDENGTIKVLDLGLSRSAGDASQAGADGHAGIHGAGADEGRRRRRSAGRHLQPGLHALFPADRPSALRRRHRAGESAVPPRPADPVAVDGAARGAGRPGGGVPPHGGQAAGGPLPVHDGSQRRSGKMPVGPRSGPRRAGAAPCRFGRGGRRAGGAGRGRSSLRQARGEDSGRAIVAGADQRGCESVAAGRADGRGRRRVEETQPGLRWQGGASARFAGRAGIDPFGGRAHGPESAARPARCGGCTAAAPPRAPPS